MKIENKRALQCLVACLLIVGFTTVSAQAVELNVSVINTASDGQQLADNEGWPPDINDTAQFLDVCDLQYVFFDDNGQERILQILIDGTSGLPGSPTDALIQNVGGSDNGLNVYGSINRPQDDEEFNIVINVLNTNTDPNFQDATPDYDFVITGVESYAQTQTEDREWELIVPSNPDEAETEIVTEYGYNATGDNAKIRKFQDFVTNGFAALNFNEHTFDLALQDADGGKLIHLDGFKLEVNRIGLNQSPAYNEIVDWETPDGPVTLSWETPEGYSDVQYTVTFGEAGDEGNWTEVFNGMGNSVQVNTAKSTSYGWEISAAVDPNLGGTFVFHTNNGNAAPVVDAGADITAWLTDGAASIPLSASLVEDDGVPQPASVSWEILSQPDDPNAPDADFDPVSADQLDNHINVYTPGTYVLQITADDSSKSDTDTVEILVYANGCIAAKQEGLYPLADALARGDSNYDCVVDLIDFGALAADWLNSTALE